MCYLILFTTTILLLGFLDKSHQSLIGPGSQPSFPAISTTTTTTVQKFLLARSRWHKHDSGSRSLSVSFIRASPLKDDPGDDDGEKTNDPWVHSNGRTKLDDFLDQQLFDPNQETNNPLSAWFASLVKNDYDLAETLYVGVIMLVTIIIVQEIIRFQLYGEAYIPFHSMGGAVPLSI